MESTSDSLPPAVKHRKSNPVYLDGGYLFRFVNFLADGSELLYCDKRKTVIGCTAYAHRKNGVIEIKKPHHGHEPDEGQAFAKIARYSIREQAGVSNEPPRKLLQNAHEIFGNSATWGSRDALTRMINRARRQSVVPKTENEAGPSASEEPFTVKQEVLDDPPENTEGDTNYMLSNDPITIPSGEFLNTMQLMITDAIRTSQDEIVEKVRASQTYAEDRKSGDEVKDAMQKLLEVLAENSTFQNLKERANSVIKNLDHIPYNPDFVLDSILRSLDG